MSGLRFCFPTTFYPPYSFGGDAIAVQRLARALVARGHEVTVIHDVDAFAAVSTDGSPLATREDDGVEVIPLRSRAGRLSPLLAHQVGRPLVHRHTLAQIFERRRFDVVNFHNTSLIGGPGIFRLARTSKRVCTAHEHWLVCPTHVLFRHKLEVCPARQCLRCQLAYRRPPQFWRYGRGFRKAFAEIDLFIAMSAFSARKHAEFSFPHEMAVVPPFCDTPAIDPANTASPHNRPYFFFAGRLEKIKGLQSVIPLIQSLPGVDLLVAGEGAYRQHLQALSGPQVKFLGAVAADNLTSLYRHALATVAPSITYETFGLTLIESFAAGTPVIARRLGPFPEIIERCNGGLLFSTEEDLLAAMQAIATDGSLRARLGADACRGHREHWSEEAVVSRYLQLVTSLPRPSA